MNEDLPTVDIDDPLWSEEPALDSWEYLCIHDIPRPANPPNHSFLQPVPAAPPPQPNQGVPVTPSPQPDQVEMLPDYELMELDILEDIPDLVYIPEKMMSEFDDWAQDVLSYQS